MTEDARALALYLLTSPHATIVGAFRLPDGYVCEDLQWGSERVCKGFSELLASGFATRCDSTKWVWITKHLEWNPLENPNQKKSAQKIAVSVPVECSWLPDFIEQIGIMVGLGKEAFPKPTVRVSEWLLNQQQEQQQEQDQELSSLRSDLSSDEPNDDGCVIVLEKAKRPKPADTEIIQDIASIWNDQAPSLGLPAVRDLPAARISAIRARIKDFPAYGFDDPVEGFQALMNHIRGSSHLLGKNDRGWKANFDWISVPLNFAKVMEGVYENPGRKPAYA